MNILEDYNDEVERLNMHPDLLPAPKEGDQLSSSDTGILKAASGPIGTPKKTDSKVNFTPETIVLIRKLLA